MVLALGALLTTTRCLLRAQSPARRPTVISRLDYVEYSWRPPAPGSVNSLGAIRIRLLKVQAGSEYDLNITAVPVAEPLRFQGASAIANSKMSNKLVFEVGTRQVEVAVTLQPGARGMMSVEISASELSVASIAIDAWPAALGPQQVAVPYYSSAVTWIPPLGLFANVYWDWSESNATSFAGRASLYQPLTNGIRNPLHDRLALRMSPNIDEVLPDIPNPKSPYMSQVSGRTVLDIWGPAFSTIAGSLAKLQTAGLKDCVILIHVWQHSGYDNGLPGHYPANAAMGGDAALAGAVQAGKNAGCLVAVHENYVDYYPNYAQFDGNAVALNGKGEKQTAWYNSGVPIQSFAARPNMLVSIASTQSREIHRRYQTSASFIDVNSSVLPWWRVDMDGYAPGAGKFSTFQQASTDLWAFERTAHGGPVFGEGNQHWFWSGLLDGVEAQFGAADIPGSNLQAPLFVDFDLLKIHPLQVNHGMGYYTRWLPAGHTMREAAMQDVYRMQEVAFGHAPFVGTELWDNIPQVTIEQNLVGPVARRYGTESVQSIQYQVAGVWTDTNAAVAARDWSRVLVKYTNGDQVVANSRPENLAWQGLTIPQNGWAVKGDGILAYTALIGGQIADYSQTPTAYFANARNQKDIQYVGDIAQASVSQFEPSGVRNATFQFWWNVLDQPGSENLTNFVHFVGAAGGIAFQGDHFPSTPTSTWRPGQAFFDDKFQVKIPSTVPDGAYSMRIGLYSISTGIRAKLLGQDDGTGRYIMGDLIVADNGQTLSFRPAAKQVTASDPRLNPAGAVVDFGAIQTDGMVSLVREGAGWTLRAYPTTRDVTVRLNSQTFSPPPSITCDAGPATQQTPTVDNGFWSVKTMGSNSCKWQ